MQCMIRLNKLGICLSPTSRLNIIDESAQEHSSVAIQKICSCCLCSLVGDNCDLRISTRHQSSDHRVQDCHFYATLLVFARLSAEAFSLTNTSPLVDITSLSMTKFLPSDEEYSALLDSYAVSVVDIMLNYLMSFES